MRHFGHYANDSAIMRHCRDRPSEDEQKELLANMLVNDTHDKEFIRSYMKTAMWVGSQFNCDRSSGDEDDNLANALVALCEFPVDLRSGRFGERIAKYSLTNLVIHEVRNKVLLAARQSHLVYVPYTSARRKGITQPKAVKTVENGSYVADDAHTCHLDRQYVTGHRLILATWQTINVETMLEQLPAPEEPPDTLDDGVINTVGTHLQAKVLRLLANGFTHREIAEQLNYSTRWVDKQVLALANNKELRKALNA